MMLVKSRLIAAAALGLLASSGPGLAQSARLTQVAAFEDEATGIAVSADGRMFVNFPRWNKDVAISVAEVTQGGAIRAYPDAEWNSWRNANKNQTTPHDHFVNVQSVVADERGSLWALDPGAPNSEKIVPGAPKLVKIDLATNAVARVYRFDETVAPMGSYLNDIRFMPDGKHAFMTDSGKGALLVLDLDSGIAKRILDGHPYTQVEKDVVVTVDGRPLRRPDGRQPEFAADGIALSRDGATLYWQALTGSTIYRVPTAAILDPQSTPTSIAAAVTTAGEHRVADGYWMARDGTLLITAPEANAVRAMGPSGAITTIVTDRRLRWPDSLAEGPDGSIYVTASHIQDNDWFKPDGKPGVATELFRFRR